MFSLLILAGCDSSAVTEVENEASSSSEIEAPSSDSDFSSGEDEIVPIPGQYIVVFEEGKVNDVALSSENIVAPYGGNVTHTYRHALEGFAAENLSEEAAASIARNPDVKYIEQDYRGHIADTQSNPTWGLDRIDQRSNYRDGTYGYDYSGKGVTAYVLDTGVRISHNEFEGRASYGYDAVDNDSNAADCHGHGTHVAGTIGGDTYGVAKDASIIAVRIGDCGGGVNSSDYVSGVNWIIANATFPSVANASVSILNTQGVQEATQKLIEDKKITLTAAAGNNYGYDACSISPAGIPEAISVGATKRNDERANFSNVGSCVDWFAPGVDILSADIGSDSDTSRRPGTSMAAPHSAGVAALYLEEEPSASPQQVRDALYNASTKNVVGDAQSANNHLLYNLYEPPPDANILGPTQVDEGVSETWTVDVSDGSGNYTYSWQKRVSQDAPWYGTCSGGSSCTTSFQDSAPGDAYANIRVFVTDQPNGKDDTAVKDVVVIEDDGNDDGGGCQSSIDPNKICL